MNSLPNLIYIKHAVSDLFHKTKKSQAVITATGCPKSALGRGKAEFLGFFLHGYSQLKVKVREFHVKLSEVLF